jgi:hypothetical protein
MDVGGPSTLITTLKTPKKSILKQSDKDKLTGKSTILTKERKHTLRSRLNVESESFSSENYIQKFYPYGKIIKHSQNHSELSQPPQ